ncbi:MAG TPA: 5'/3'-nucleotidase SurE [Opitutales bacterium]|nr:5'/3'-nucleotidase SurE [Opitutales bacterium]
MPPVLLITNDDGIDSHFLRVLVESLQEGGFDTRVAAPLGEQSWISRALSRRRDVHLASFDGFGCPAWTLDGTPTDCVNIALSNLLPEPPAAVISGINLSTNVGLPHILASGTVAGALEGAFWGLPALAFSMELPRARLAEIRHAHGRVGGTLEESLRAAGIHAVEFVRQRLAQSRPDPAPMVHNINFPSVTTSVTPVVQTRPANLKLGALFRRESPACFKFHYRDEIKPDPAPDADATVVAKGCISHSILDYSFLGA